MKTPFIIVRALTAVLPFMTFGIMIWYFKKKKSHFRENLADFYTSYHVS